MKRKVTLIFLTLFFSFTLISLVNSNISLLLSNYTIDSASEISTSETAQTSWTDNGTPIYTSATYPQDNPQICSDGAGGAIIAWADARSGTHYDIYAQKIFANGSVAWTPGGVAICTDGEFQLYIQICSDGAGGAIISWTDYRTDGYPNNPDVYARKINANGVPQWTSNGVSICTESNTQGVQQMCSDGTGGAIITWIDDRASAGNYDLYAQRVLSTGAVDWTPNGVIISTFINMLPSICSDGSGGAIITWQSSDLMAQKVNPSGVVQWAIDGVPLTSTLGGESEPDICSDGNGGAIIVWKDWREPNSDIYARKINSIGGVEWIPDGVPICTSGGDQEIPQICSDGEGGAIITWQDGNIYAQKINQYGSLEWITNGEAICTATGIQRYAQICSDGAGGAIITWEDCRGLDIDIYAQKISKSGAVEWTTNGHLICNADGQQQVPQICSDGEGGAIITWDDARTSDDDIYAQRIIGTPDDVLDIVTLISLGVLSQYGGFIDEFFGILNKTLNILLSPLVLGSIVLGEILIIMILSSVVSHQRKTHIKNKNSEK